MNIIEALLANPCFRPIGHSEKNGVLGYLFTYWYADLESFVFVFKFVYAS